MFWPTDTLHPLRPRRASLPRHSLRPGPLGYRRRTSVVLIVVLVLVIMFLTRVLGRMAREVSPQEGKGQGKMKRQGRGEEKGEIKFEFEVRDRMHATSSSMPVREVRDAEDVRQWLASRRRVGGEEGSKEGESESTKAPNAQSNIQAPINLPPPSSPEKKPSGPPTQISMLNTPREPLGNHTYHPNGLLQVNPAGPHPIYELIQHAEKAWIDKHRRASKTLREAVQEYKRRYGRLPPTGFDIWWGYTQKHHIPLPDEYDQINEDLAPFWAISPSDLQATQLRQEAHSDSFTIGKEGWSAPFSVLNFSFNGPNGRMGDHPYLLELESSNSNPDQRKYLSRKSDLPDSFIASARDTRYVQFLENGFNMINMLEEVQEYIPPFRAVFSPHDNPSLLRDWKVRQRALEAARNRETLDVQALENAPRDYFNQGWRTACSPSSPAHTIPNPANWDSPSALASLPLPSPILDPSNKTFIHTHEASMDPCLNPSHFILSGQFISHKNGPVPERHGGGFIPMFSFSPTRVHNDITVAAGEGSHFSLPSPPSGMNEEDSEDGLLDGVEMDIDIEALLSLPDDELDHTLDLDTDPRLLWRGSNTGIYHAPRRGWERSQRHRLVFWAGGGEGAVLRGMNRETQEELGKYLDLKTANAFGAGLGGTMHVLIPPPNDYSDLSSPITNGTWVSSYNTTGTRSALGPLAQLKKSHYAPSMLDIAFAAANSDDGGMGPSSCEPETCKKLREIFEWRKRMEMNEASRYRFVMDVDGHAWSSRFRKLLVGTSSRSPSGNMPSAQASSHTNLKKRKWEQHLQRRRPGEPPASLVLKATIYKEWWFDRAQPWVHYVPIQMGLEDLWDVLIFFRGKLGEDIDDLVMELRQLKSEEGDVQKKRELEMKFSDALERHVLGRRIARRGRKWAERYWRKEDMVAYMFRLYLEYARVMSLDRDKMFFDPDNPEWGIKAPIPQDKLKWNLEVPKPPQDNVQNPEDKEEEVLDDMLEWYNDDAEYDWMDYE